MTTDNYDIDALGVQLAELRKAMENMVSAAADLEEMEERYKDERKKLDEEYRQQVFELNERAAATRNQMWDYKSSLREIQQKYDSMERQYSQAQSLKSMEEEYLTLEKRWDRLTDGAKWREFAKEHQLTGARRMTYARRLILADTVGLGKTLTGGVAAVDMIKAATTDGDKFQEPMRFQDYHAQNSECVKNGCRATDCGMKPVIDDNLNFTGEYFKSHNGVDDEYPIQEMYGKCVIERNYPPAGRKILYICPVALTKNVEAEYKKWSGNTDGTNRRETVVLAREDKRTRRLIINNILPKVDEFVVIINYEAWRKDADLIEDMVRIGFDTIILDEAHNIKDRRSIAYRGVRALLDGYTLARGQKFSEKVGNPIRFVFPMTGTPILNRPQELFTMLTLVEPERFSASDSAEQRFLRDYCRQEYDDNGTLRWTFKPGGVDSLLQKFGNRILRRDRKSAGIVLPPQEIQYHNLIINEEDYPEQARVRLEMRTRAMIVLDPEQGRAITAPIMLAVYTRLRQIETWPAGIVWEIKNVDGEIIDVLKVDVEQSQKLDYLIKWNDAVKEWEGLIPEVCPAERTVVFSQFTGPMDEIKRRAEAMGLRVATIRGGQTEAYRNEIRIDADRYHDGIENYHYKYDLLLVNYKAGGVGLNLNDFTQTIILDEEWNPGKRDQAYGRTDRMGQTEETTVHVIRMQGTIDAWMAGLIDYKENMVSGFESSVTALGLYDALKSGDV